MRLIFLAFGLIVISAACGDSYDETSKPCNEDPWVCPTGQSCWFNADGTAYQCLNQGPGQEGSDCDPYYGSPSCAAGLFCLKTVQNDPGACRRFCSNTEPGRVCLNGEQCTPVAGPKQLATILVCSPPS